MTWDEAKRQVLAQEWARGTSCAEIGLRLGITKNAVIGQAHRLKLTGRPSPIRGGAPRKRRPRLPKVTLAPLPSAPITSAPPPRPKAPVPAPAPRMVQPPPAPSPPPVPTPPLFVYATGGWGCQWITRPWKCGELPGSNVCGQPRRARDSSWCDVHRAVVFTPRFRAEFA